MSDAVGVRPEHGASHERRPQAGEPSTLTGEVLDETVGLLAEEILEHFDAFPHRQELADIVVRQEQRHDSPSLIRHRVCWLESSAAFAECSC